MKVLLAIICLSFSFSVFSAEKNSCKEVMAQDIEPSWLNRMLSKRISTKQKLINDAVQAGTTTAITKNQRILRDHNPYYTNALEQGVIADQQQSGRCWIYAGTNMLRSALVKSKTFPADFNFSQAYLHFFSQLERANNHLESLITLSTKKTLSEKKLRTRIIPRIGDGAFSNDFRYLVEKYGLVPDSAMPDTANAKNTDLLLKNLNSYLLKMSHKLWSRVEELRGNPNHVERHQAARLGKDKLEYNRRPLNESELKELRIIKTDIMEGVWSLLVTHLGNPPTKFRARVPKATASEKEKTEKVFFKEYSPVEFSREVIKYDPMDYVVVASLASRKRNHIYVTNGAVGEIRHNIPFKFLNLSNKRMEELTMKSIDEGAPVYTAARFDGSYDNTTGIMHPNLKTTEGVYGHKGNLKPPKLTDEEGFYYYQKGSNHAVVIDAYDKPIYYKRPVKFRVQNSWGKRAGDSGNYHMYREWFEQHVYFIVIHKNLLAPEELKIWEKSKPQKLKEDEYYH